MDITISGPDNVRTIKNIVHKVIVHPAPISLEYNESIELNSEFLINRVLTSNKEVLPISFLDDQGEVVEYSYTLVLGMLIINVLSEYQTITFR